MAPSDNETDRLPSAMTRWEDLTDNEKTAVRQLARGELHDVPARMIRRLAALGLAEANRKA